MKLHGGADIDMKEIIIQFSTPKNFWWYPISFFIRFFECPKSLIPFRLFCLYHSSHVSMRIDNDVSESVFFLGCRKIPFDKWEKHNNIKKAVKVHVPDEKFRDLENYMEGNYGIPYAFLELFGIMIAKIWKSLFKKEILGNPFKTIINKRKCTESVYIWLIKAGKVRGLKSPDLVGLLDVDKLLR